VVSSRGFLSGSRISCSLKKLESYTREILSFCGQLASSLDQDRELGVRELLGDPEISGYLHKSKVELDEEEKLVKYLTEKSQMDGRCSVFVSQGGHVLLANSDVQPGDKMTILKGGRAVYILRPAGDEYTLVSTAFVHGLMEGQAVREPDFEDNVKPIRIR
jgi:hypothetical protein